MLKPAFRDSAKMTRSRKSTLTLPEKISPPGRLPQAETGEKRLKKTVVDPLNWIVNALEIGGFQVLGSLPVRKQPSRRARCTELFEVPGGDAAGSSLTCLTWLRMVCVTDHLMGNMLVCRTLFVDQRQGMLSKFWRIVCSCTGNVFFNIAPLIKTG